jgi:DNA-binding MltR family transcriptional regulator
MTSKLLKKIIKDFPSPAELREIMSQLRIADDRSSALVATSILENSLERLLISSFKNKKKEFVSIIFENNGPLSSLWSKNMMAYAIGLIEFGTKKEIDNVRVVRNVFAHALRQIDFTNAVVLEHCLQFGITKALREAMNQPSTNADSGKKSFLLAVELLVIVLDFQIHNVGGEPIYVEKDAFYRKGNDSQN